MNTLIDEVFDIIDLSKKPHRTGCKCRACTISGKKHRTNSDDLNLLNSLVNNSSQYQNELYEEYSTSIPPVHLIRSSPNTVRRNSSYHRGSQLNELGQPEIKDPTMYHFSDSKTLLNIVNYLDVENSIRYRSNEGKTYCNVYAYDYCTFAGAYLPRVWWKKIPPTSAQINHPKYGIDIKEMSANNLFDWLIRFGSNYWWEEVKPDNGDYRAIQNLANDGHVLVVVQKRQNHGHVLLIIPESNTRRAKYGNGKVILPVHSQAGTYNFSYNSLDPRDNNNKTNLFRNASNNDPNIKIYLCRIWK